MISADAISAARAVPIEDEIARRGIRLRGGVDRAGPCPGPNCGGTDRFGINTRKQIFKCRQCGAGGDVIALVRFLDGCDFATAIATLAGDYSTSKAASTPKPAGRPEVNAPSSASTAAYLWSQCQPITEGSPPWLYLHKRGYAGLIPATLGYLPPRGDHGPAMIAAFGACAEPEPGVIVPPKSVVGVHLTRLTSDGDKAPNPEGKTKIMVGRCKGLPIVISPPNDLLGMAITEGVEDALSVHAATGLGVWAAGAAGFMPALAALVPDYIEAITICAHDDEAGQRGALELARLLDARGFPEVLVEGVK